MEQRAEYLAVPSERPRLTVVKDDGGTTGYSALPHAVLFDATLSQGARLLYAVLQAHWWQGGECWASHATLATQLGCKERMLRYYIRELIGAGKITERRRGRGQAKAYAPADQTSQPATDCQFNRQDDAASDANRQDIASQPATDCQFNRQPVATRRRSIEEDSLKEEDTGVVGGAHAPHPTAEAPPKARSEPRRRRLPEDWSLTDAHYAAAAKRGLDAARAEVEAEKFCDYHRAKGTVMLDWMAAWRTWLGNAVTFDARRQPAPRNGSAQIPPGAASKQKSSWLDPEIRKKFRVASNVDPTP